eukprot:3937012-Rhodomonas_salina.1
MPGTALRYALRTLACTAQYCGMLCPTHQVCTAPVLTPASRYQVATYEQALQESNAEAQALRQQVTSHSGSARNQMRNNPPLQHKLYQGSDVFLFFSLISRPLEARDVLCGRPRSRDTAISLSPQPELSGTLRRGVTCGRFRSCRRRRARLNSRCELNCISPQPPYSLYGQRVELFDSA